MSDYEDRNRIVTALLGGEITAQEAAAMLSMISKAEQRGEPVPGYAGMLDDLRSSGRDE